MKKRVSVLILILLISAEYIHAQQSGISQKQLDTIKSALQRIAISNNAVERVIYDGMTYKEVIRILNVEDLDIQGTIFEGTTAFVRVSFIGKYIIYWSGSSDTNPIVIGYSARSSKILKHNTLE